MQRFDSARLVGIVLLLAAMGCGSDRDASSAPAPTETPGQSTSPEESSDEGPALIPATGEENRSQDQSSEENGSATIGRDDSGSALLNIAASTEKDGPTTNGPWPQWRGPRRDGISAETGLLTRWPNEGLPVLWKVEGGEGYSCIAVSDGRLYTMFDRDDTEWLVCLDAQTGEELWIVRSADAYKNSWGNGPRGTPTVEGPRVYSLGATGRLMCVDKETGSEIWQRNILEDFGAENLQWGVSTSPLIEGDMLLVGVGGPGASVVALNKLNGEVIWQQHDDVASYSSPIAVTVDGVREIIFYAGKALFGVAPTDGAMHWHYEWLTTNDMNIATPIYDPATRLLFVSASRDTGRCSAYRLGGQDGTVVAEEVYTNKNMRNHFNSCVLVDGYLYGFDNSTLKCLRLEDGEEMWEHRSVGKGSLVYAQGHLFLLSEDGVLGVAEATPEEYREHGRMQILQRKAWTPPVLAGGKLYVRDERHIACLNIKAP